MPAGVLAFALGLSVPGVLAIVAAGFAESDGRVGTFAGDLVVEENVGSAATLAAGAAAGATAAWYSTTVACVARVPVDGTMGAIGAIPWGAMGAIP